MRKLIIIKLGGSVITYKDSSKPKIRAKTLRNIAGEIAKLYHLGYQIIVVHGGGSFAHPVAKKFGLTKGFKHKNSQVGFAKTSLGMDKLNTFVNGIFMEFNVPAVSLAPHAFIRVSNGQFINFDTKLIGNYLHHNFLPVLYGDAVIDTNNGCSILSGDIIIPYLAKKLKASKVIFLADVEGIFNKDPRKYKTAKLIPTVNNQNLPLVLGGIESGNRDDVTGEMAGKILALKNLKGIKVTIASGFQEGNLTKIVEGQRIGTTLLFD